MKAGLEDRLPFRADGYKSELQKVNKNDTINPMVIDITKTFRERSSSGGRVVFEGNYDKRTHTNEIETAVSVGGN